MEVVKKSGSPQHEFLQEPQTDFKERCCPKCYIWWQLHSSARTFLTTREYFFPKHSSTTVGNRLKAQAKYTLDTALLFCYNVKLKDFLVVQCVSWSITESKVVENDVDDVKVKWLLCFFLNEHEDQLVLMFLIPSFLWPLSAYKQHLVWLLGRWLRHIWVQPIHRRGGYPSVQTSSCCWKAWVTGSVSLRFTGWADVEFYLNI